MSDVEKPAGAGSPKDDPLFLALIGNLQLMTFVYLGKVGDPGTGEQSRNLPAAKASIDTLRMLRLKTRGNLGATENQLLDHVIFELELNYVDEATTSETASPDAAPTHADDTPADQTAN